ncbi:hypothetical protein N9095_00320 [bacterium]|nr:hypothetical protein [bacterium]
MGYLVDIDSSERDPIEYPNPNDYTVHLNDRIYDITSIKLVSARIPNCQPLINSGNKQFEVNGTSVVLDEGTYTNGDDLASNLQIQMAPPNTVVDTVTFDSFTKKLNFSNTSILGEANVGYSTSGSDTASNLESFGEFSEDVIYIPQDDTLNFVNNLESINFLTGESFSNSMNAILISSVDYFDGINFVSPNVEFTNTQTTTTTNVYYDSDGTHMAEMLLANIGLSTTKTNFDIITFDGTRNHFNFANINGDVSNINVSFISGNVLATDIQSVLAPNTSIDSVTFDSTTLTFSNTLGGVFDDFVVPFSNIGETLASSIQTFSVPESNLIFSSFDISTNLLSFSNTSFTRVNFSDDGNVMARNIETSGMTNKSCTFDPDGSNLVFSNAFSMNFYGGSNGYATNSSVGPSAHIMGFNGSNTQLANSITSSFIDIDGPGSLFVRITSGPDDLDKKLFINGGTFTTNQGTFEQQNMIQIAPHYIGRLLLSNIGTIQDFKGVDDPIQHTFVKGTGKFIDDLRIRFYYNNGTKLIPYDFGKRNHILKVEIECSMDKGLGQVPSNTFSVDSGDLPPPVEIPNLMPKNRFDNSQKSILIVSVISLLLGLAILSFMKRKRTL